MLRRRFLTALGLALTSALAQAAPQRKPAKPAAKPASKPSKPAAKPSRSSARNARGASRPQARGARTTPDPVVHEAPPPKPITENLPDIEWSEHELICEIRPSNNQKVHIPLPLLGDTSWQRLLEQQWESNASNMSLERDPLAQQSAFTAQWSSPSTQSLVRLRYRLNLAVRTFDISHRRFTPESPDILRHYVQAIPRLADVEALRRHIEPLTDKFREPIARVKAVYEWSIEEALTTSSPECVPARFVKSPRDCSDVSTLFVAACRAIGIPAREWTGYWVDRSRILSELGRQAGGPPVPHRRVEAYVAGYGWIPADPAAVVLAARYTRQTLRDSRLIQIRKVLFGLWEGNWVAFNTHDGNEEGLYHDRPWSPAGELSWQLSATRLS